MVGNDIVDIKEASLKSNWQRPRFLEKLFTLKEQQCIHDAENSFLMVWRLWSMKEAAYKLFTQLQPSRFYNPKRFECTIDGLKGMVQFKDFVCYLNTEMTQQYILSEARLDIKPMTSVGIHLESNEVKHQSARLKEALISKVSKQYDVLKHEVKLVKSEFGIPLLYHNSKKLNIGMSLSHHGTYGTYAISKL
ncbi:MAG: 4'-phosphopantetheinyl transferase superfamily protein [Winogradskyella sp.]|uniref:4'-phosphopantetheinyl transferase family protein n=1 Tax=Winogradskyella sp. TaxID=1883156 RepID=UPI0038583398